MHAAVLQNAVGGEPLQPAAAIDICSWSERQPFLRRIAVRSGDRILLFDASDIEWIEGADYYARIHGRGKSYLLRKTLSALEERLDPGEFCRVHRSAIVNVNRVKEIHPYFGGSRVLVLETGTRVVLSRRRRSALELALGQDLQI